MDKKTSITLAELTQLLKSTDGVTVIDVRSEEEFKERHIPFAINLPADKISSKTNLDLKKTVVTVCGVGGGRSAQAADFIRENYKADTFYLEEGTFGWIENENKINSKNKSIIQNLIQLGQLTGDTKDEKLKK